MNVHTFDNFGLAGISPGPGLEHYAGFSWYYCDPATLGFSGGRQLLLQITCAGRVSQPVPVVVDDFGSICIPLTAAF